MVFDVEAERKDGKIRAPKKAKLAAQLRARRPMMPRAAIIAPPTKLCENVNIQKHNELACASNVLRLKVSAAPGLRAPLLAESDWWEADNELVTISKPVNCLGACFQKGPPKTSLGPSLSCSPCGNDECSSNPPPWRSPSRSHSTPPSHPRRIV